jgi:hypothetical protein
MGFRNVVNDGSSNPPRLRFQREGGKGLIPQVLERIAGTEFGGIECPCPGEQEADELGALLRERGLAAGCTATAAKADDLLGTLELAHRMGADYLSVRVTGSLKCSPDIADVLRGMYELVNDAGLPLFIETRGASVTQDLRRTVKVVHRFKKVRFAGDFSHYAAIGEFAVPWSDEVWDHFDQIARRCGIWHGRLQAGEMAEEYKKLWTVGMGAWLKQSRPGDVLPFCCEEDAIKRLAEEAWAGAQALRRVEEIPVADIAVNQGVH